MTATERIKEISSHARYETLDTTPSEVPHESEKEFLLRALKVMREIAIFRCWNSVVGRIMSAEQQKHTQEETFPKWIDGEFNERMGKAE